MPEVKKFESEKVSAALKLLRALPEKDNRKSLHETLVALSGGIQTALAKGYSRREIRNMLVEAGVVISTTSLNNFLSGEQKKISVPPAGQKLKSMEASTEEQVNTKGMDSEQKKLAPKNTNGFPEKQEQAEAQVCTCTV